MEEKKTDPTEACNRLTKAARGRIEKICSESGTSVPALLVAAERAFELGCRSMAEECSGRGVDVGVLIKDVIRAMTVCVMAGGDGGAKDEAAAAFVDVMLDKSFEKAVGEGR